MAQHLLDFYRYRTGLVNWQWDDEDDERKTPINIQVLRDWTDYLVSLGCDYYHSKYNQHKHCLDKDYDKINHPYYLRYNRVRFIKIPKQLSIKILALGHFPLEDLS